MTATTTPHTFKPGDLVIHSGKVRIFHYEAGCEAIVSITIKGKLSRVPLNQIRAKEWYPTHTCPWTKPCPGCAPSDGRQRYATAWGHR